ncbi:MAG TPA: hypothetical protein VN651_06305 [Gemmatimonadaceae bacterium]|nr:hypothetical protein [Gemmatimonadaceae bacterium]
MSHLSPERLAALVDESPSSAELAHLAGCGECARERAVYRSLGELAANEAATIGAPLSEWSSLRRALVADGVIDTGRGALPKVSRGMRSPWLQAAAAVLFVAGGMMAGRYTAGAALLPSDVHGASAVADADSVSVADSLARFASLDDARLAQARAQLAYQSATAYIAQNDTTGHAPESPDAMRTRLAALDQAYRVMGQALDEAPYDPVINGYYLTTLGQREATIRQLNTVLPASMRITSY